MPEYSNCRLPTLCPLPQHLTNIVEIYVLVSHQARPQDRQYSKGSRAILLCHCQPDTVPSEHSPSERSGMHAEYHILRNI